MRGDRTLVARYGASIYPLLLLLSACKYRMLPLSIACMTAVFNDSLLICNVIYAYWYLQRFLNWFLHV